MFATLLRESARLYLNIIVVISVSEDDKNKYNGNEEKKVKSNFTIYRLGIQKYY